MTEIVITTVGIDEMTAGMTGKKKREGAEMNLQPPRGNKYCTLRIRNLSYIGIQI